VAWIDKYVTDVRPGLVVEPDDGVLFLTNTGDPFTPNRLTQLVRNYVDAAEIGKRGACHLFRHTMATIMLENGADIRFIQEMLGHAELSTTQIYTQVSIKKLKEIHTATHPSSGESGPSRLFRTSSPAPQTGHPVRLPKAAPPARSGFAQVRDRREVRLVGVRGFEPPTSASRTQRSTKLSHTPVRLDRVRAPVSDRGS